MMNRRGFTQALGVAQWLLAGVGSAEAQTSSYPAKQIQMVVGFPAGQSSDVSARMIASQLGTELKQSVWVDNRVGASGIIAHQYVKGAPADGYTLLYGSSGTLAINPTLYKRLPYDPLKDFTPVVLINTSTMFLVTAADSPVKNFKDFVSYVRAQPGKVSYGSSGNGTTGHIAMELLKMEANLDLLHVPYKGSPPMMTDLIAGRVQFAFDVSNSIMPFVQSGRLKLLGASTSERVSWAPDVPTIAEQGLPGFEAMTWAGIVAPTGTPANVIETLNAAANRALAAKTIVEYFNKSGSTIRGGSPADFGRFIQDEIVKWRKAVLASGAQID
jgi:tripartite-type tricarboxylate transporter receptor subunit TctC